MSYLYSKENARKDKNNKDINVECGKADSKEKLKRQVISIKTEKNNFLSHEISETRTFGKNTDTFFVEHSFLCIFCNFSNQC